MIYVLKVIFYKKNIFIIKIYKLQLLENYYIIYNKLKPKLMF